MNDYISKKLWQDSIAREYERMKTWHSSPHYLATVEQWQRDWLARPLHERLLIILRQKITGWRIRLGELIAGQTFD